MTVLIPPVILTFLVALFSSFFVIHCVREYSMEPVLRDGQTILVLKRYWDKGGYKPGDILVFQSPESGKMVVKRCVLAPGDPLDIRHGWLFTTQGRYYLSPEQKKKFDGIYIIPENSIFATGDNSFRSADSRSYGFIPLNSIEGRVIFPSKRSPGQ